MAEDGPQPQALRPELQLPPVGEKLLPAKCKPGTLTYCPTMDLIALVTEDDELHVFRLNGQKVVGGSFKGDPYLDEDDGRGEIRALRWKNNGAFPCLPLMRHVRRCFVLEMLNQFCIRAQD